MEGNETAPAAQEQPERKMNVDRKVVDSIFEKMKASIASEPVEGEVKLTRKMTLAAGSGIAFYVADEHSEKAAKVALQMLALKFSVDLAELMSDPEKFLASLVK